MILETAIYLRLAMRINEQTPCPVPTVRVAAMEDFGRYYPKQDIMVVREGLTREKLEFTVWHESMHKCHWDYGLPKVFGKPPFVSEYASTNAMEDFAELGAHHFLYGEGPRKKRRALLDLLNH